MRRRKIIIVSLCVIFVAAIIVVIVGGVVLRGWFRSDPGGEWTYTSPDHAFSIRVPSRDWKQATKPDAAVAFHNPKHRGICLVRVTKETRDVFEQTSVPWIKSALTQDPSELLSPPHYKEGRTAVGNPYAYWKVKAKADRGGAVFVACSVVWCEKTQQTVKVTMEGELGMTSQAGSSAEWEYFEKAADLLCLSPD